MAADFLSGLLGGGGADPYDLYGDLFTEKQRAALRSREMGSGLLKMAGAFAEAAKPSRVPIPFGAALGQAAAAYGSGQDQDLERVLKGMQVAEGVRESQQKRALNAKLGPIFQYMLQYNIDPNGNLGRYLLQNAGASATAPAALGAPAAPPGMPAVPGAPPASNAPPGAPAAGTPPGGLLTMGSDYAGQLGGAAAPPGLLNYPGIGDGMAAGGGALAGQRPFDPGLGTATPLNQYGPGGALDPFAYGAPNTETAGAPPRLAAASAPLTQKQQYNADIAAGRRPVFPPGTKFNSRGEAISENLPTIPPDVIKSFARANAVSGSGGGTPAMPGGGAPPELSPGAGEDTVIPSGSPGLLGVSNDLRAPVEADPFARVDAVLAQIKQRESGGNYAIPPWQNVDYPRSHASGAHQFQPGTWREWTQKSGFGREYPEAYLAPAPVQDAVARYAALHGDVNAMNLWGASAGKRPYPDPRSGGPLPGQDTVIPSGRGVSPSMLRNVADTSGGAAPGAPPAGDGGGYIPGLGMTPQGLAALNALTKMGGLGEPFGSLLETYYKSPEYLKQSEQVKRGVELEYTPQIKQAERSVTEPSDIRIAQARVAAEMTKDMALQGFMIDTKEDSPTKGQVVPVPGYWDIMKGREDDKQRLQQEWQAKMKISKPLVLMPDGSRVEQPMTDYEIQRRLQMQGTGAPRPGDIVGTPYRSPEAVKGAEKSSELGVTAGWKALEDAHAREIDANRRLQSYGQIAEAMQGFRTGATAETRLYYKGMLRDLGVIEGADVPDGEVAQRAMRRLQLDAASVTKGSTSDYERSLIAQGAAQLGNTPEAVIKMIDQMRRLDEYDQKIAQIHRDVADKNQGMPNVIEAQRRIAALGPPLSPGEVKALERVRESKAPQPGQANPIDQGPEPIKRPYGTIQRVQ